MACLRRDAFVAIVGENMTIFYSYHESPLGQILLTANASALTGLHFVGEKYYPSIVPQWTHDERGAIIQSAKTQLNEYFAGDRQSFDLKLAPEGTPFQRDVWHALTQLGFGETASYAQVAQRIGKPKAVRAVGAANGRNPISIVVPCHRVIGANGALTGYAGGLARKEALLRLEASAGGAAVNIATTQAALR
jgi:methylated-DNA-[protein]-cysteine S-methyltransferase